jgi:diacylglycerol kinase (ATP)
VTQVALVVQPVKADKSSIEDGVRGHCARAGWPEPIVLETTPQDPGGEVTRKALDEGAELVLAAGGDGTVRAVAEALVGTGVPLGVVPAGTGNLLARNLGLPLDAQEALAVAFGGTERTVDVGRLSPGGEVFVVMAGLGFDAAMMREAPEGLKDRVGWMAYLVGGARALREERLRVEITLDDGPPRRRSVRAVLVGNVGQLQGGMELLPGASPDDGLLDVAVLAPQGFGEWLSLLARAVAGRHPSRRDPRLERLRCRSITVRSRAGGSRSAPARELDGDLIDPGTSLSAEIVPGALVLRVADEGIAEDKEES